MSKKINASKTSVGECPKCKSLNLTYEDSYIDGEVVCYEFICDDCKCIGKEWYSINYIETVIEN